MVRASSAIAAASAAYAEASGRRRDRKTVTTWPTSGLIRSSSPGVAGGAGQPPRPRSEGLLVDPAAQPRPRRSVGQRRERAGLAARAPPRLAGVRRTGHAVAE